MNNTELLNYKFQLLFSICVHQVATLLNATVYAFFNLPPPRPPCPPATPLHTFEVILLAGDVNAVSAPAPPWYAAALLPPPADLSCHQPSYRDTNSSLVTEQHHTAVATTTSLQYFKNIGSTWPDAFPVIGPPATAPPPPPQLVVVVTFSRPVWSNSTPPSLCLL